MQERNDLPAPIAIVVHSGQQLMLTEDANRFFKKVEFDPPERGEVRRVHPAGAEVPPAAVRVSGHDSHDHVDQQGMPARDAAQLQGL
ncbi:MAG: hypothetical protein KY447_07145 [Actinobacteria bacterium]|nr:hypothetical protein [Actinomycetota bacterium]